MEVKIISVICGFSIHLLEENGNAIHMLRRNNKYLLITFNSATYNVAKGILVPNKILYNIQI